MVVERLKELMVENDIKQVKLGEVMGYKQPMVSQILGGTKSASINSIRRVADEFEVSLDWLYGRAEKRA